MQCWKCGEELEEMPRKVPFKAICEKCHQWQHACKNCKNYHPGKPNNCLIPGTELIADRESFNFCEEFEPSVKKPTQQAPSTSDVEKRLFGDSEPRTHSSSAKERFDDLFGS